MLFLYLPHIQLARQGLNVVIMSRSEEKLQKVADEISEFMYIVNSCMTQTRQHDDVWSSMLCIVYIHGTIIPFTVSSGQWMK